jgi:hypothetical protein
MRSMLPTHAHTCAHTCTYSHLLCEEAQSHPLTVDLDAGLPLPRRLVPADASEQFAVAGCSQRLLQPEQELRSAMLQSKPPAPGRGAA